MLNHRTLIIGLFAIILTLPLLAQMGAPDNWFNLDPEKDKINGVSSDRIHADLLQGLPGENVIVAVIDGGVDPLHEDLKAKMWINKGEIAGNGVDDDGNGYIDDIHGWNFIGGADGENVHHDSYELTRIVSKLAQKYENANPDGLTKDEKEEYARYMSYKKDVDKEVEKASEKVEQFDQILTYIKFALNMSREALGDKAITKENIDALDDDKYAMVKGFFEQLLPQLGGFEGNLDELEGLIVKDMEEALEHEQHKIDYGYNVNYNPRPIVNDNYGDLKERFYGNNDVKGPDAFHGTHVAGIIGADRQNDLGIKGVAEHVRIMAIRAVPDGDERDKDVANAIRYAVDNGAKVVNMSFGKGFSPNESEVEKAIRYAEKKDVLLVHAAGNSNQNNDENPNFPNGRYDQKRGLFMPKVAKNWIEVGALSWEQGEGLVATFSNYGKANVDLFAPGHEIYSTTPDGTYEAASGTSMAAPVVSGVAAIIRAHFPKLKAKQVKELLTESTIPYDGEVRKPGSFELVPFSDLSKTGGVVNARQAIQKAIQQYGKIVPAKKIKPQTTKEKGRA